MKIVFPERLNEGDTIGIVAPSGPVDVSLARKGINSLEEMGFTIKQSPHLFNKRAYLAGSDEERASSIESMFRDKKVKAILCARGGYGAIRALKRIDINIVKENPKIFIGFSDATIFLNYFFKRTGLVTFHGPMLQHIGENDHMTLRVMRQVLSGESDRFIYKTPQLKVAGEGRRMARLIGGCLSVLLSTLGTEYEPEWQGRLLFIEDVDEPLYKMDRMLTQLRYSGRLDMVTGIIVGRAKGIRLDDMKALLRDILGDMDKPAVYNFPAGHNLPNLTLPIGGLATLNTEELSLTLEERCVA